MGGCSGVASVVTPLKRGHYTYTMSDFERTDTGTTLLRKEARRPPRWGFPLFAIVTLIFAIVTIGQYIKEVS